MLYYALAAFLPTSSYIADPFTKHTHANINNNIITFINNFIIATRIIIT